MDCCSSSQRSQDGPDCFAVGWVHRAASADRGGWLFNIDSDPHRAGESLVGWGTVTGSTIHSTFTFSLSLEGEIQSGRVASSPC